MERAKFSTSSALRVTGLLDCLPKVSHHFPQLTLDSLLAAFLPSSLYAREGDASMEGDICHLIPEDEVSTLLNLT